MAKRKRIRSRIRAHPSPHFAQGTVFSVHRAISIPTGGQAPVTVMAVAADSHRDFLIPEQALFRSARQRDGVPMLCVYSLSLPIIAQIPTLVKSGSAFCMRSMLVCRAEENVLAAREDLAQIALPLVGIAAQIRRNAVGLKT